MVGPVLPASLAPEGSNYWVVGIAAETFGQEVDGTGLLLGLDVIYRIGPFGPHLLLMMKPNPLMSATPQIGDYEEYRALAGLGLRGHCPLFGTEWSYGIGAHAEIRLQDHYWTYHFTPFELGTAVFGRGSWRIELFYGARYALGGDLINHFIIDPNGFDSENARDELDLLLHQKAWTGFFRVVFGRRID